jgi:cytochrome oxidase Cu insertion factor (SCO1/SenC/PrrC family)
MFSVASTRLGEGMKPEIFFVQAKNTSSKIFILGLFYFATATAAVALGAADAAVAALGNAETPADFYSLPGKWTNEKSETVQLSDFKGLDLIVTMSYTSCRKTCPEQTIANLKKINAKLKAKKSQAKVVIISFDPEGDKAADLAEFKEKYSEVSASWTMLVGDSTNTRSAASFLKLGDYWKIDDAIVHGSKIVRVSPEGKALQTLDFKNRNVDKFIEGL